MKKVKCDVCGYKFEAEKEKVYTTVIKGAFFKVSSKAPQYMSVMDCPKCGCQAFLKFRMQRIDDDEGRKEENG